MSMMTVAEKQQAARLEIQENKICSIVGRQLQAHYPGYTWFVECRWQNQCVVVKCLDLHGDYGFVLGLADLLHDITLQLPITAGGELLERCNLPRGAKPVDMKLDRDVRGNVTEKSADLEVFGGEF